MQNIWHDIDNNRVNIEDFIVVIEISKGSKKKYELDKETGMIILDRVLHTSMHYPSNYGFIPRTYAQDNDPLDVLVLSQEILDPLVLVRCKPIGVIKMIDNDDIDEKIIAVPFNDPTMSSYNDISELPKHQFEEFSHFFSVYKQLEKKETIVLETKGRKDAIEIIQECIDSYKKLFIK